MKCRFLKGRYMLFCRADVKTYIPSAFEAEEYCKTARHKVCPLYMAAGDRAVTLDTDCDASEEMLAVR